MNLSNKPLAMAYVPWQSFENVMDGGCGLKQGTIFEDLIFPFVGSQAACQAKNTSHMPNQKLAIALAKTPTHRTTPMEGEVDIDDQQ